MSVHLACVIGGSDIVMEYTLKWVINLFIERHCYGLLIRLCGTIINHLKWMADNPCMLAD